MALTNKWKNKTDGVDDVLAEDINNIAEAVIALEKKAEEKPKIEVDLSYKPTSTNAQSGVAVAEAIRLCSNALIGQAEGTNAVRIDDINPLSDEIEVSLSSVNLINQEEFFKTNSFEIKGEIGKTYIFTCAYKDGVNLNEINLNGGASGIFDYYTDENGELTAINGDFVTSPEPWRVTITEGHEYFWKTHVANASDIFESVSMVLADISDVNVKSYGKNLIDISKATTTRDGAILEALDNETLHWKGTYSFYVPFFLPKGTPFTMSYDSMTATDGTSVEIGTFRAIYDDDDEEILGSGNVRTFTPTKDVIKLQFYKSSPKNEKDMTIKKLRVELGNNSTAFEPYKEPVDGAVAISPTTTLIADANGVEITAEYNKDINKVIAKLEQAIVNL